MKVKLHGWNSIYVDGKLMASGTITEPIHFASYRGDTLCGVGAFGEDICDTQSDGPTAGAVGDWGAIRFNSGSDDDSTITRAVIRHSGRADNNFIDDGSILLNNASPNLSYITFDKNYINGVKIPGATWQTDTWDNPTIVYVTVGNLTIPAANTLTINPGMKVKLHGWNNFYVDGKFATNGSAANPIYFTSYRDDTVCGIGAFVEEVCDTSNDGITACIPGDWGTVHFSNGSDDTSLVNHTVFKCSGRSNNNFIDDSAIRLLTASPTIRRTVFLNNYNAFEILNGSTPTLICNGFEDNLNFAIYNNAPTTIIGAKAHWWGDPCGPAHSGNPDGTGQKASDGVDYTPWAVQPCVLPWTAFSATPTSGPAPLIVVFTNLATVNFDSCAWDFGDGAESGDCNPVHTYESPGTFTVTLAVSVLGGTDAETKVSFINVYAPVSAGFSASLYQGAAPLMVEFFNESTGAYSSCALGFGDGSTSSACNDPDHAYVVADIYSVTLTVRGLGGSDSLTRTDYITVRPHPPTLHNIVNPAGNSNYSVSWSSVAGASTYELQERQDSGVWNTIYTDSATGVSRISQAPGLWCYGVRAISASGNSDWSDVTCTLVNHKFFMPIVIISTP